MELRTAFTTVPATTALLPVVVLLGCVNPVHILAEEVADAIDSVVLAGKFGGLGGTNFPNT